MRPDLNPRLWTTYTLRRPRTEAFWRAATCDEVDCVRKRNGWRTVLDLGTTDGVTMARWISEKSGRSWTHERAGNVITFTFQAGQNCFERHRLPIEREPLYIVRPGSIGHSLGQGRQHARGLDWVDDMQANLDKVREAKQRG